MKTLLVTLVLGSIFSQAAFAKCSSAYINRNEDITVPVLTSVSKHSGKDKKDDKFDAIGHLLGRLESKNQDSQVTDEIVVKITKKVSHMLKQEKCEETVDEAAIIQHLTALNADGSLCPKVKMIKTQKVIYATFNVNGISDLIASKILKQPFEFISNKDFEVVK